MLSYEANQSFGAIQISNEKRAMLPNCSGFYKEGKVTISAGLCYFHQDFLVKHRKTVLFTSNTKVENKFSKGEIISA